MRIAVDVCVGKLGVRMLRAAGHRVLVAATHGERDAAWFKRVVAFGVDIVVSADVDIEILCYDNRIEFFRVFQGERGHEIAARLIRHIVAPERVARPPPKP